ncbi:hypothetical protein U1Q18_004187 [Sarracenia purpurea var. burkii]
MNSYMLSRTESLHRVKRISSASLDDMIVVLVAHLSYSFHYRNTLYACAFIFARPFLCTGTIANTKARGLLPQVHLDGLKKMWEYEGPHELKRALISVHIVFPIASEVTIACPPLALQDEPGASTSQGVILVSSFTDFEELDRISKISKRLAPFVDLSTFLMVGTSKRKGAILVLTIATVIVTRIEQTFRAKSTNMVVELSEPMPPQQRRQTQLPKISLYRPRLRCRELRRQRRRGKRKRKAKESWSRPPKGSRYGHPN